MDSTPPNGVTSDTMSGITSSTSDTSTYTTNAATTLDVNTATESSPLSTTAMRTPALPDEGGRPDEEDDYYFRTAELGIPFALTAAIVIVLCITVMYTRYRRSRMRRNGQATRTRNIHGVPLWTAAYNRSLPPSRAYPDNSSATHSSAVDGVDAPPSYGGGGYNGPLAPPQYYPMQPFPMESPPKYEDIIKNQPGTEQGVQTRAIDNQGFTLSEESTQTSLPVISTNENSGSISTNQNTQRSVNINISPVPTTSNTASIASTSNNEVRNTPTISNQGNVAVDIGHSDASDGVQESSRVVRL